MPSSFARLGLAGLLFAAGAAHAATGPDFDTQLRHAADRFMRANHIRHLTVLSGDGTVAGILAQRYVLYDMLDDLQRNVGDLLDYIVTDGPGG